jgi:hypothetical protein
VPTYLFAIVSDNPAEVMAFFANSLTLSDMVVNVTSTTFCTSTRSEPSSTHSFPNCTNLPTDNAQLHIRYTAQNGDITITDKDGKILPWVPVKEWKRQINNALEDTITFSDESFFWEGEWTGGIVTESDYRNGFYQYMNENKDNVFKITSVGGPYTLIPHFEILGK